MSNFLTQVNDLNSKCAWAQKEREKLEQKIGKLADSLDEQN